MKRPMLYSREELEEFSTEALLVLKKKWSLFLRASDETSLEDSKFLQKEAKNNISLIRDIVNSREVEQ